MSLVALKSLILETNYQLVVPELSNHFSSRKSREVNPKGVIKYSSDVQ